MGTHAQESGPRGLHSQIQAVVIIVTIIFYVATVFKRLASDVEILIYSPIDPHSSSTTNIRRHGAYRRRTTSAIRHLSQCLQPSYFRSPTEQQTTLKDRPSRCYLADLRLFGIRAVLVLSISVKGPIFDTIKWVDAVCRN